MQGFTLTYCTKIATESDAAVSEVAPKPHFHPSFYSEAEGPPPFTAAASERCTHPNHPR